MVPEDVLLEAITVALANGDSPELRAEYCAKLIKSIRATGAYYAIPFVPHADNGKE